MEESLAYIMEHGTEFKWCRSCNCFNSSDNTSCHNCGSTDFAYKLNQINKDEADFQANNEGLEPEDAFYTVK